MANLDQVYDLARQLKDMGVESSKLAWVQYTAGYDFGIEEAYKKRMDFLKNKDHFKIIEDHMKLDLSMEEKRKMEIMYKAFEGYHKSDEINDLNMKIQLKVNELSKILNTFRYQLDGTEMTSVQLQQILNTSPDRDLRKKAYLAKNQINKPMVDAGFLDLVEMRKKLAELNGFESFVDYMLYQDDLESDIFFDWKDQLHELLPEMDQKRKEYANKYLNDDVIYPWDEAYVGSLIAPCMNKKVDMSSFYDRLNEIFSRFGFDLDQYNITYDIFPRKNKSEWGYNFPIETRKDSRILANVKDKFYEFGVLLHETGHGVHSYLNDPDLVILNGGISGIVTEGIANLFGGLLMDENFYSQFFDEDIEGIREQIKAIKKWRSMNSLRTISRIMFDQEFYRVKNESLEDVYHMYWQVQKDYLKSERMDYDPPWAFVIHHTTHPIYYHNYFMGDVTCEMLAEVFNQKEGTKKITDQAEKFGKFLVEEVVKPSGLYPYSDLFKRISGKSFSLNYLK